MTMISSCGRGTSFSCFSCLALLLVLHYHQINRIHGQKSDSALTVVENTDGGGGGGGDGEEEKEEVNLKVVQPTEQWQSLKPGQAVPAGSHVRLNLQTGQREVRLGEEQLKYWTQEHQRDTKETGSFFSPDELKQAMKKIKEDLNPVSKDPDQQVSTQD
uniref:Uncharacterized protein n=1 Tax=Seriola lalandi dorsalis TaxID=1841481 RepID=A0A3B4X2G5_SERLL